MFHLSLDNDRNVLTVIDAATNRCLFPEMQSASAEGWLYDCTTIKHCAWHMLILIHRIGETLVIGEDITVTVLSVKCSQVRIGVNALGSMPVH